MSNSKTTARVQVTLEVNIPDAWLSECAIDQLYRLVKASALNAVSLMIMRNGTPKVCVIGEPKVLGIITEMQE